jgi:hypothetical protein
MSTRWNIGTCTIIAVQGAMDGLAPFNRCQPIVQSTDKPGLYGIVNATWGDFAIVSEIEEPMLQEALSGKAWTQVGPLPLTPYADVWMLRPCFPFREDALAEIKAVHGPEASGDTQWAIVRMDADAEALLRDWCDRAEVEAVRDCAAGNSERALLCANLVISLCNAPEKCGLYMAILEETGHIAEHNKALQQFEAGRGPAFTIAVMHCKQKTLTDLYKQRCALLEEKLKRLIPEQGG